MLQIFLILHIFHQVEEKKLIHSTCYKSTASLETIATVDQLTFLPSSKNAFHHNGTKNIEKHVEFGNFRVGMKVVLFRDNKVLTGTIRFIGKLDNLKEMTFGIELVSSRYCFLKCFFLLA